MSDKFEGHTPGPWSIEELTSYSGGPEPEPEYDYWEVIAADGGLVCTVWEYWDEWTSRGEAHAALIAAAPDLLAENERLRYALRRAIGGYQNLIENGVLGGKQNDPAVLLLSELRAALGES